MQRNHQALLLLVLTFVASSREYSTEELNSVRLTLNVTVDEYTNNVDGMKDVIYELIANVTTANCTVMKQDCKLVAKYPRKYGSYKREIVVDDYVFTPDLVSELKPAEVYKLSNGTEIPSQTLLILYMTTYTKYDYLKWTELVRILYWWRHSFNELFNDATGRTGSVLLGAPDSYIANVDNTSIVLTISCVMIGSALLMFIIVVPLSRTKYCRRDLQEKEDGDLEEVKKA